MYYLQSRYYDPEIGRFINADGYVSTGQDINGSNMFSYCGNNPITRADTTGQFWEIIVGAIIIVGLVTTLSSCSSKPKSKTKAATPSTSKSSISANNFKNKDGSYSLYDNRRHSPNNVFHEQILSAKVSKPAISLKDGTATLGSASATLITGGWEVGNFDLSLLDFGKAKVAAGCQEKVVDVSAMASIWAPSVTVVLWDVNISISVHVGSVGGKLNVDSGKFDLGAAYGWGASLSVDW